LSATRAEPQDGLPPIRDVPREIGVTGSRRLGQHFIHDLTFTGKIARLGGPIQGTTVLEIGPGPGALTRSLLAAGASRVIAVERDSRFLPALEQVGGRWPGRLTLLHGDARNLRPDALLQAPARIVANLPYEISALLLARWLRAEAWPPPWQSATVMLQREMAERISARHGTRSYGRLSVLAQWRARTRILAAVPPSLFLPPPKVESALLRLEPRIAPAPGFSPATLAMLAETAFRGRRKTLRRSLRDLAPAPDLWFRAAGVDPGLRADQLPVEGYCALAHAAERLST